MTLAEDPHIEVVPVEARRRSTAAQKAFRDRWLGAKISMPVPWLQLIDAALGVANFARGRKAPRAAADGQRSQLEPAAGAPGGLEARLAGVVVAALKEAFDRDTRRLELEREQLEAERERAERALRLELQRQAGDREIGRLRLLAGVAVDRVARHAGACRRG